KLQIEIRDTGQSAFGNRKENVRACFKTQVLAEQAIGLFRHATSLPEFFTANCRLKRAGSRFNPVFEQGLRLSAHGTTVKSNLKKGNRRRKKICLFGHFGSSNIGNEVTFQTMLYHLCRLLPDAEVACVCTGPGSIAATHSIEAVQISSRI